MYSHPWFNLLKTWMQGFKEGCCSFSVPQSFWFLTELFPNHSVPDSTVFCPTMITAMIATGLAAEDRMAVEEAPRAFSSLSFRDRWLTLQTISSEEMSKAINFASNERPDQSQKTPGPLQGGNQGCT